MIALWIVLGILLFFLLLLSLRAHVLLTAEDDVTVTVKVLFLRFRIFPKKPTPKRTLKAQRKKEKKEAQKQAKADAKVKKAEEHKKQHKKKSFPEILRMIKMFARILKQLSSRFSSYFRLKLSRMVLRVGGPDAAQTAVRYGAISAAVSYLATLLEQFVTVKTPRKSELRVEADFVSNDITYDIMMDFSVSLRAVLALGIRFLFAYLKERKHINKKSIPPLPPKAEEQIS